MCSPRPPHKHMPKLYFASDHAGFTLKDALIAYARHRGYEVEDMGASVLDQDDDYPDFVTPCAKRVVEEGTHAIGIVIGASGQGEAMCANRVPGIRAAVFYGEPAHEQTDASGESLTMIASVREHNDANVLALGARFVSLDTARVALQKFIDTPFSGAERHVRRLGKF